MWRRKSKNIKKTFNVQFKSNTNHGKDYYKMDIVYNLSEEKYNLLKSYLFLV